MKNFIIKLCGIFLAVYACVKTEPVSPVPEITFKSFELVDAIDTSLQNKYKMGILEFSFIDGDADIGMYEVPNPDDAFDENNYNLFLIPYEKRDSTYYKIKIDTTDTTHPPPYYTIMHDTKLDRAGQNKTIKGTIIVNIPYFTLPEYDTMRYDFYIVDRVRNKSNIESTTDIGFNGLTLPRSPL
jgi:hypothetical protein